MMNPKNLNDHLEDAVTRIQSYLTEEEAKIIIPQFRKNFLSGSFSELGVETDFDFSRRKPDGIISGTFYWDKSPEGGNYWYKVSRLIEKRYESENK